MSGDSLVRSTNAHRLVDRFADVLRPQKPQGLSGTGDEGGRMGVGEGKIPGPPPCSHSSELSLYISQR